MFVSDNTIIFGGKYDRIITGTLFWRSDAKGR